ncbi:uncharacterized protein ASPGLDRAFT_598427 [Aspergillus glaucus CBS 516.65]|uniref:Uncharacterized protein n=1 Tax=Aspergillus glaucus CBS 516.65 TaxID=1160497 RepID=A0A1L9VDB4_ASPGL|nr:hypothetical protein ASPGLDRAFT_598427 [Aspergillus glaucus CBS 516.65]OJJ81863.1 hypothetical protein ASPGLDRAFT_598427 [Aspergillus glaucus CBS 516.65]
MPITSAFCPSIGMTRIILSSLGLRVSFSHFLLYLSFIQFSPLSSPLSLRLFLSSVSPSQTMTHFSPRLSSVAFLKAPTPSIIPLTSLRSHHSSGFLVAKTAPLPP